MIFYKIAQNNSRIWEIYIWSLSRIASFQLNYKFKVQQVHKIEWLLFAIGSFGPAMRAQSARGQPKLSVCKQ